MAAPPSGPADPPRVDSTSTEAAAPHIAGGRIGAAERGDAARSTTSASTAAGPTASPFARRDVPGGQSSGGRFVDYMSSVLAESVGSRNRGSARPRPDEAVVNPAHVAELEAMGFSHSVAVGALLKHRDLNTAAEYLFLLSSGTESSEPAPATSSVDAIARMGLDDDFDDDKVRPRGRSSANQGGCGWEDACGDSEKGRGVWGVPGFSRGTSSENRGARPLDHSTRSPCDSGPAALATQAPLDALHPTCGTRRRRC